jgi:hypothetical protein
MSDRHSAPSLRGGALSSAFLCDRTGQRLLRLLDHKFSVLSNVLDERQLETARIHDALLMIHAGRHVPHSSPDDSTTR